MTVVVVVPFLNEAENLPILYQRLCDVLEKEPESFELLFVDDGSSDGSAEVAELAGATVVRHPLNLGQGAALQTGIQYALSTSAQYVMTFDADGQHRVSDAVAMLELARSKGVDVVLGSRFLQRSGS